LLLADPDGPFTPAVIYGAFIGAALLAVAAGLLLPLAERLTAFEEESLVIGAALFLFCFIGSSNWDYRLIFVIFLISYFLRPTESVREALTGVFAIAMMLAACNLTALEAAWGDVGIKVNFAGKSLLYVLVVYSAVRVAMQRDEMKALSAKLRHVEIVRHRRE
jgi:hypothetical protein